MSSGKSVAEGVDEMQWKNTKLAPLGVDCSTGDEDPSRRNSTALIWQSSASQAARTPRKPFCSGSGWVVECLGKGRAEKGRALDVQNFHQWETGWPDLGDISLHRCHETIMITLEEVCTYERTYRLQAADDKYAQWGNSTKGPFSMRFRVAGARDTPDPIHFPFSPLEVPTSSTYQAHSIPPQVLQLPRCTRHLSLWHGQRIIYPLHPESGNINAPAG